MTTRRHYLVSYDIADDKRRNKVFDLLEGRGAKTRSELYEEAKKRNLKGRSTMNREQLQRALQR